MTKPDWSIERLTDVRQLDDVLDIERASFSTPWTREMYVAELGQAAIASCYLAKAPGGRTVGFCSFRRVLDEVHVNNLAVAIPWRRRGVAASLLRRLLADGAGGGAVCALLEVRESNRAARALYERFGFGVVGVRRAYYSDPVEDALVLKRDGLADSPHRTGS